MVINGIGILVAIFGSLITAVVRGSNGILWIALIQLVIGLVFMRLGSGLRRGERQAVYGLCLLGSLAILAAVIIAIAGGLLLGALCILALIGIYLPPIVSAFRHWHAFH